MTTHAQRSHHADDDDTLGWDIVPLDARTLGQIDGHVARLRRLHTMPTANPYPDQLTEAQLLQAHNIPLTTLLQIPLRYRDQILRARCPFHRDGHVSFTLYSATNVWYCFSCQRYGDPIAFIRYLHGVTYSEAVRLLLDDL